MNVGAVVVTRGWVMRHPGPNWSPGTALRVVGVSPPPFDYELENRHGERCYVSACEVKPYEEARHERNSK